MDRVTFKGFAYGAIAAASYGLNPLFALPLYADGMGADSVLFYRYAFGLVMLGVMMVVQRQSFALRRCEVLPLVVMGLLFSFSSLTLFLSYNYMDAGIASTILFVYPVLVAILMAVFFKEKISPITMISIALAFTGISLLYQGEGGQTLSLIGVALVFLSSLTYALYIIGVNRSVLKDMPIVKLTFYVLLFGLSVYVVRLKFCTQLDVVSQPILWINPVCLALGMPCLIPYRHFAGDNDQIYPLHRFYSSRYFGCLRAADGYLLWRVGIRRAAYSPYHIGHCAYLGSRYAYYYG